MSFDVFRLTFDTLRLAIQDNSDFASESEHEKLIDNFDEIFTGYIANEIQSASSNSLSKLQALRNNVVKVCKSNELMYRLQASAVIKAISTGESSCGVLAISSRRKNDLQRYNAEKRMKELVFEIIGEYGKCKCRLESRQKYVAFSAKIGKLLSTWRLSWQRYLLRLTLEVSMKANSISNKVRANGIHCEMLCFRRDSLEVQAAMRLLNNKRVLGSDIDYSVGSIIRITKQSQLGAADTRLMLPNESMCIIDSVDKVVELPTMLSNWLLNKPLHSNNATDISTSKRKLGSPRATSSSNHRGLAHHHKDAVVSKLKTFLKSSTIAWMLPGSYPLQPFASLINRGFITNSRQVVYTEHVNMNGSVTSTRDSVDMSDRTSDRSSVDVMPVLDKFILEMVLRNGARVDNDRIYFCLEERASLKVLEMGGGGGGASSSADSNASPTVAVMVAVRNIQVGFYCYSH